MNDIDSTLKVNLMMLVLEEQLQFLAVVQEHLQR